MPRMRIIKPEFWSDEKISRISILSRLTYIGLWNLSDDYGVVKGNPVWIKGQLFPYDDGEPNSTSIRRVLVELEMCDKVRFFECNGETFYFIPKFLKHQRIDRKSRTRNPEPPQEVIEGSTSARLQFGDISMNLEVEREEVSMKQKGAASPPSSSRDLEMEDKEFYYDCVEEVKKAISGWYTKLNKMRPGAMASKAVQKLNRVIKVHPEALVWIIENKMPLPANPDDWYRFVNRADDTMHKDGKYPNGGLRPALCHEWASEARHACPLVPRLELKK